MKMQQANTTPIRDYLNQMQDGGDYRHRLFISYGAMSVIFSFLTEAAILKSQSINRFMYVRGVSRIQLRVELNITPLYFLSVKTTKCDGLYKVAKSQNKVTKLELAFTDKGFFLF